MNFTQYYNFFSLFAYKRNFSFLFHLFFLTILFSLPFTFAPRSSLAASSEITAKLPSTQSHTLSAETQNEKKLIRIGYEGNFGIFQANASLGNEGYGYELFHELKKYTKNRYEIEFVEVAWAEGMKMLLDGKLDLLPLANYTEERAKSYGYTKVPFVYESPVLLALKDNASIGGDYSSLNGAKICIHPGNVNYGEIVKFLKTHHIDATITEIPYKPISQIREEGYFDYTVSSSLQLEEKLNYAFSLQSHPLYMLGNKNNQALLDDFDYAVKQLDANDFLFEKKLFVKYFSNDIPKRSFISDEEFIRLQDAEYNVGIMNLGTPVSFYNDKLCQMDGLAIEAINKFTELTGIKVHIHELKRDASRSEIEKMDFFFLANDTQAIFNFTTSEPFVKLPYVTIKKANSNKNVNIPTSNDAANEENSTEINIATFHFLPLSVAFVKDILKTDKVNIFTYNTLQDFVQGFHDGIIDIIIITRASYNALFEHFDKEISYTITKLDHTYDPVFSFSKNFPQDKIDIFNKLITHLDSSEMADALIQSIDRMNTHSIHYYLMLYWYIVVLILLLLCLTTFTIYRAIKKQREYDNKLANEINPTTGLYTFNKFLTEARELLAANPSLDARIVTLDIDNFRYINEIYGFNVGTQVLKQIAHHIKQNLLSTSPIAHYGGDVFCILTPKVSYEYKTLVEAFHLDSLNKAMHPILGEHYELTISAGVYDIKDKSLDISYMIDCANIARQKSKTFFGSHIEIFNEQMKDQYTMQTETLALIKNALKNKEFELFYQPKFDIDHMHVVGAEALIRWFRNGKMIPPDQFIPIAEKHGLINELDYHVIELACQFISTHKIDSLPHISINVSGFTIVRSELVDKLIEITKKYDVKPQEIDIEITETALVNNFDMAIKQILALRELGFTISMDDFGTGVSSLNRLSQMPLDTIKLDRIFIMDALENKKSSVIVRTVIELAKNIDAKTVAEGIETQEQLELLRKLSCEHGQGYFYARPMPQNTFLDYLKESRL